MSKLSKHKLEYEDNETFKINKTKGHKMTTNKYRSDYQATKSKHKNEIKKLREQIKKARKDIRQHKLLIKQARLTYKIVKSNK